MKITLKDIFNLTGAVIYNPDSYKPVSSVSIDTRTIKKNSLFVAIKGEKFNGHKFVNDAVKKGANAVLISQSQLKNFDKINSVIITVPNTIIAYGELANLWRKKLTAKVISITGSNGKTATKEILTTLLKEKYKTSCSIANNNNHIGVPLTILSTRSNCQILILEHGTNHFNEIDFTAKIAEPDISLITNIGDSHLEFLQDREGVYKEKSSLFNETIRNRGLIFVNNDDPLIRKNTRSIKNKISFGFEGKPKMKGKITGYSDDGKTKLLVSSNKKKIELEFPLYGISNAKNVLSAVSVAIYLELTKQQILHGIKNLKQINGRLNVIHYKKLILIDDTYNSNPASVEAAIDLMNKIKIYKSKTVILGDMFELGKNSVSLHKDLIKIIKNAGVKNVFTIGKMMKNLSSGIKNNSINTKHFGTRNSLKSFIIKTDFSNQLILVKGSRGMRMEEFSEIIRSKAA